MSSSTESLRKKVCVTVFLDELFEEVQNEDESNSNECNDVKTVLEGDVEKSSKTELNNCERERISSDSKVKAREAETHRQRKCRRESKFSKNSCKLLKNINKYKTKLKNANSDHIKANRSQSALESAYSESDLNDCLKLRKNYDYKDSVTEISEIDEEKKLIQCEIVCTALNGDSKKEKAPEDVISYFSKSTQVDSLKSQKNSLHYQDLQNKLVEELAWQKTRRQLQVILAKAKNWYEAKEACEMARMKRYDLRSILEECEKAEKSTSEIKENICSGTEGWSTDIGETESHELTDSYTCIFPHTRRKIGFKTSKVKKIHAKKIWKDNLDSDMSEFECFTRSDDLSPLNIHSVMCYTSCVNSKMNAANSFKLHDYNATVPSESLSEMISRESSAVSLKSKESPLDENLASLNLTSSDATNASKAKKKIVDLKKGKNGSNLNSEFESNSNLNVAPIVNSSSDKMKKKSKRKSKMLLCLKSEDKLLICKEILKHVESKKNEKKKIVLNSTEIQILPVSAKNSHEQSSNRSKSISEVFFKRKLRSDKGKIVSDVESETIFADTEAFPDCTEFYEEREEETADVSTSNSIEEEKEQNDEENEENKEDSIESEECHDSLSRSNILSGIKTLEILGDSSKNSKQNLNTEVILICDDISNKDLSSEDWQSASTIKSLMEVEMGQCYLKDSKDSSMYLVEIPFHFTRTQKQQLLD